MFAPHDSSPPSKGHLSVSTIALSRIDRQLARALFTPVFEHAGIRRIWRGRLCLRAAAEGKWDCCRNGGTAEEAAAILVNVL
jgi:hypothetical protein